MLDFRSQSSTVSEQWFSLERPNGLRQWGKADTLCVAQGLVVPLWTIRFSRTNTIYWKLQMFCMKAMHLVSLVLQDIFDGALGLPWNNWERNKPLEQILYFCSWKWWEMQCCLLKHEASMDLMEKFVETIFLSLSNRILLMSREEGKGKLFIMLLLGRVLWAYMHEGF